MHITGKYKKRTQPTLGTNPGSDRHRQSRLGQKIKLTPNRRSLVRVRETRFGINAALNHMVRVLFFLANEWDMSLAIDISSWGEYILKSHWCGGVTSSTHPSIYAPRARPSESVRENL